MTSFQPDYHHIVDAASNKEAARLPLYEHVVGGKALEAAAGRSFWHLSEQEGGLPAFYDGYCQAFNNMGYDTVSFECCIGGALVSGGALGGHVKGVIQTREDFERYPWEDIPKRYFEFFAPHFASLRNAMPEGMSAIGGVGNGVFELAQDLVGYMDLCVMRYEDPGLYADLFQRIGDMMAAIWHKFIAEFGDIFCVLRFGDDLGFKTNSLISREDIIQYVIPQYKRLVDLAHGAGKKLLLHSCGNIFNVMDDIISIAHIDAKHSNEDVIAPFNVWVERYGDRIGNFGGIDTDVLCRETPEEIREYVLDSLRRAQGHGGIAFGSGNSIPDYVPTGGYLAMIETVRDWRGDRAI